MPKRTDIESILILGAGPIIIGQACEFDYSGTQACRALREEGYRVVLVNSNPATIMTDPDMADASYIEPVNWETVREIIKKERIQAILPTMGGQTALNCALDLSKHRVLEQFGVEMIGANEEVIKKAEDRALFCTAMQKVKLRTAHSLLIHNPHEAKVKQKEIGYPTVLRPSCTLGGSGSGIAKNEEEFVELVQKGLKASPLGSVLLEESLVGWKEFEMEVIRDRKDNCIVVCCIENIDPMGIHTGDSITVAPCQTLTDKEYQAMRSASFKVLREIGVDTGGANVQFAVHPKIGEMVVVEMNPRVSRSSALASKATGFPIAKVAAKLAVGYTLEELGNEITGNRIPASFEPTLDYVVTKIPRFAFDKFPYVNRNLTTQMKSVGECMAIGRNFQESLHKAMLSLETGVCGFDEILSVPEGEEQLVRELRDNLDPLRLWRIGEALRRGIGVEIIHACTQIDKWFLRQIEAIISSEAWLGKAHLEGLTKEDMLFLKRQGFADLRIASLVGADEHEVRRRRIELEVRPVYKRIDTCAAEFESEADYFYSSYDLECEVEHTKKKEKIIILGGGPNRIGQGIEFDYCCVHAVLALKDEGVCTVMVNCNPETVSTDYDMADRLYFEPLSLEHVLNIVEIEEPDGVIVHYGGQTPLNLADDLERYGVPIIGTDPGSIRLAEDRRKFDQILEHMQLKRPPNASAMNVQEAMEAIKTIGYPIIVRASYVLGGQSMQVIYCEEALKEYMELAERQPNHLPILVDAFLAQAKEVDVDAVCDGQQVLISPIMEHIEEAGIHSGDSACSVPPLYLTGEVQRKIVEYTRNLALRLNVVGLMNVQFAVKNEEVFILEVNPRASRTVPFVSKISGVPFAKIGALCMKGHLLKDINLPKNPVNHGLFSVREAVFPFDKLLGSDPILGPEMHSTGEVMGIAKNFGGAFRKAQLASGNHIPKTGCVLLSIKDSDKPRLRGLALQLIERGFTLVATEGTARELAGHGIDHKRVKKVREGHPNVIDQIKSGDIDLIVNTTEGQQSIKDSFDIRNQAIIHKIYYSTTIDGAFAFIVALGAGNVGYRGKSWPTSSVEDVYCLQEIYQSSVG